MPNNISNLTCSKTATVQDSAPKPNSISTLNPNKGIIETGRNGGQRMECKIKSCIVIMLPLVVLPLNSIPGFALREGRKSRVASFLACPLNSIPGFALREGRKKRIALFRFASFLV